MNAAQYLNKESIKSQLKVIKIDKKDFSPRKRKVKRKVEDKIISLTIIELSNTGKFFFFNLL